MTPREIRDYQSPGGRRPFWDWLYSLKDKGCRDIVIRRVDRLAKGNPGDAKVVGLGVWELRIHHGPGFRVYYGEDGPIVVILLCGGDKDSQRRDIEKAQTYWQDYQRRQYGPQRSPR